MGKDPEKPKEFNLEDTSLDVAGDASKQDAAKKGSIEDLFETAVDNPQQDPIPEAEDKEAIAKEVTLGKIIAEFEDTSLDVESLSEDPKIGNMPDTKTDKTEKQGPPSSKLKLAETDEFSMLEMEDEEPEPELEEDEEKASKFRHPASILDLIKGKDDSLPEVVYQDTELETRIEGKSLEEVLKVSQKGEGEWHNSKIAEEGLKEKAEAAKKRQRKLLFWAPLIILAAGVASFYIILPTFNPLPETDKIRFPKRKRKTISPEKLKIDPNLKDENKLQGYLQMAQKLFDKKKYDKAEIVYRKILPTGWNISEIFGKMGQCRELQKDENGAVEFYSKAIAKDYGGSVDIPLRLAEILKKQGKHREILYALEPIKGKFLTSIPLQGILAETYLKLDMPKETLAAFRRLNKQCLTQEQLQVFAKLLMEENDTKEAFKVYLFLGQNFRDMKSLYKASQVAPNPKLKIAVLTELVGKTRGQANWDQYKMLLGEEMLAQGQKREALKVLDSINTGRLSPESSLKFIKVMAGFEKSASLLEACESIIKSNYLKNFTVQKEIRDILLATNKTALAEKLFKKLALATPDNPVTNFMYASVAHGTENKIQYYNKTLTINSDFYPALMDLGKLYCDAGQWDEALKKFKKCSRLKPDSKEPRYWMAIVQIRENPSEKPLQNYAAFLANANTPEPEKLKEMISLAHYLPNDRKAMEYLVLMSKYPEMKTFMELQTIRTKLIYGTLKDNDFAGKKGGEIKKYRILYLLSQGRIKDVMMMPTLKSEFPEYWKVFICWRKNISSWRGNTQLLEFKHPNNTIYILSSKLWQWEISPADAEKQINNITYEQKPLLFLMMAERYRKDGNKVKSSIFYQTSIKFKQPNIYKGVAEYFKDH